MRLDFYMRRKENSKDYEFLDSDYVNYDTSNLNIDNIRIFLIKLFKGKYFSNKEYKIKINHTNHKMFDNTIKQTVISIFFEYDILISRDFRIKKVLQ